jgi:hypothetical protein
MRIKILRFMEKHSMDYGGLESGVMESLRYKYFPQFENLVV